MKRSRIIIAAALLAAIALPSTAQAYKGPKNSPLKYGVNISFGFPQSDFGKFSSPYNLAYLNEQTPQGDKATEGAIGGINFGIDFKVSYCFGETDLKAYAKLGMHSFHVKVDNDEMNKALYESLRVTICGTSVYFPTLFNIPTMVGARYDLNLINSFGFFAEAGLGLNLRLMNKYYVKTDGYYPTLSDPQNGLIIKSIDCQYKAKAAVRFAFEVGAGLNLTHWCSVGFYYINLGKAPIKGTLTQTTTFADGSQRVDSDNTTLGTLGQELWALRLGLTF